MSNYNIQFNDFKKRYSLYKHEIDATLKRVLESGWYILGREVESFEKAYADYIGVNHAIGVASGTDALYLALLATGVGVGDEVITVANTAAFSVVPILQVGAKPIFVDVDIASKTIDPMEIEKNITKKTKVVIPVHLYGNPAEMSMIMNLANKYNLVVIEDAAQAHGAEYNGKKVGSIGDMGCFSFYPTKNLGAFGDGGMITTNNEIIAQKLLRLRNYGEKSKYHNSEFGINSRLDEIQAALLSWGLDHLEQWNKKRTLLANCYLEELKELPLGLPTVSSSNKSSWHLFVIMDKKRDALKEFLYSKGIATTIHYPMPLYKQPAFCNINHNELSNTESLSSQILSLPLYPEMNEQDIIYICDSIKDFYNENK